MHVAVCQQPPLIGGSISTTTTTTTTPVAMSDWQLWCIGKRTMVVHAAANNRLVYWQYDKSVGWSLDQELLLCSAVSTAV
jgi:hypothetical protein